MSDTLTTFHDMQVLVCSPEGKKLKSEDDAVELIGEALSEGARMLLVPVERLDDDFFQLKTRLAGHFLQKFVTYRRHLVILGDISQHLAQSQAFRDFVSETNRGNEVWFMKDLQELGERLNRTSYPGL